MTWSGSLRQKVQFEKRATVDDDYGNREGDFVAQFTRRAEIIMQPGREEIINQRLQGVQPMRLRVRFDQLTATIAPDWQARDARSDRVYAIKAAADPDGRRRWIEMLCIAGEPS